MTELARRGAEEPPVKWLTPAELDSWLSVVRLMAWLPWSIDQQLRRDSKLGMVEYQALAAAAPGHVAHVRSLVVDVLSPEQLRRMGLAADRIMSRIDAARVK